MRSYPKIYAMGHNALKVVPYYASVVVQEKVDGSQFRFWLNPKTGEVECFSKRARIYPSTADKLFKAAVTHVESQKAKLLPGAMYYGEVLHRPKHNTLEYDRVPFNHIALFDVSNPMFQADYFSYRLMLAHAQTLEVDAVPMLWVGRWEDLSADELRDMLEKESFLGGPKIEGVVLKFYNLYGQDGKVLMAKHVSEKFKEMHQKVRQPSRTDVVQQIADMFTSEARWRKAVQHLRDDGDLTGTPKDIGPLIAEIQRDIDDEEGLFIGSLLYGHFKPRILRETIRGFPQWYKEQLLEGAF